MEFTPEQVPLHPKYDPAQPLIIQPDEDTLSIAEKVARDPAHILEVIADKKEAFITKLAQDYVTDIELNGSDVSRLALAHRRKDVHAMVFLLKLVVFTSGIFSA